MAEISKSVADRILITRGVITAIEQDGAAVAAGLEGLLFPDGVPENLTVGMFVAAMAPALERICDDMAAADVALAVELADDGAARDARDASESELAVTLASVYSLVDGAYGGDATTAVGLPSDVPDDPEELVQSAAASADLLESTDLGPAAPGVTVDRDACAQRLRTAADDLDGRLKAVATEEREAQATRTARDECIGTWRRGYVGLADAFSGLAYAIGQLAIANRTRTTSRRRQGRPEPQDTGTPTGGDPTAGGPTSGPAPTGA